MLVQACEYARLPRLYGGVGNPVGTAQGFTHPPPQTGRVAISMVDVGELVPIVVEVLLQHFVVGLPRRLMVGACVPLSLVPTCRWGQS